MYLLHQEDYFTVRVFNDPSNSINPTNIKKLFLFREFNDLQSPIDPTMSKSLSSARVSVTWKILLKLRCQENYFSFMFLMICKIVSTFMVLMIHKILLSLLISKRLFFLHGSDDMQNCISPVISKRLFSFHDFDGL